MYGPFSRQTLRSSSGAPAEPLKWVDLASSFPAGQLWPGSYYPSHISAWPSMPMQAPILTQNWQCHFPATCNNDALPFELFRLVRVALQYAICGLFTHPLTPTQLGCPISQFRNTCWPWCKQPIKSQSRCLSPMGYIAQIFWICYPPMLSAPLCLGEARKQRGLAIIGTTFLEAVPHHYTSPSFVFFLIGLAGVKASHSSFTYLELRATICPVILQ